MAATADAGNDEEVSYGYQLQAGSDSPEIGWVAGDDALSSPLRTNHDMGIDDVGRRGSRQ